MLIMKLLLGIVKTFVVVYIEKVANQYILQFVCSQFMTTSVYFSLFKFINLDSNFE